MGLFGSHTGSWGLPDFGITEAIGKVLGVPNTYQGGSNLAGNYPVTPQYTQNIQQAQQLQAARRAAAPTTTTRTAVTTNNTPAGNIDTGGGGGDMMPPQPQEDPYAQLRGEISSGWDNYINSLNDQLGGIQTQRTGQEEIANAQYTQGVNTLGLQKTQGVQSLGNERQALEQNQVKTLRDLVENQRQAFQAGNNFLGTRGASDSSAANQYSFALAKEAGKQRGDIMTNTSNQLQEINQRETNLNNIYNTEVNNLEQTKNSQFGQIAQWFGDAQNKIRQMQASGQLNKSQDLASLSKDILNQAISEMNRINTEVSGRRTALENWAMTNSKNIAELKANMQQASAFSAQLPQFQQIAGTPQVDSTGNMRTAFSYGGLTEEEKKRRALSGQMV